MIVQLMEMVGDGVLVDLAHAALLRARTGVGFRPVIDKRFAAN